MPDISEVGTERLVRRFDHDIAEKKVIEPATRGQLKMPPFFLVGCPRSGTTMLRLILNGHPELAIPSESHFLIPLLQQYQPHSVLTPGQVKLIWQFIAAHPRFSAWQISAQQLWDAYGAIDEPTLHSLIDVTFRLEVATSGKQRWGEKTPIYTLFIDQLHDLFPDAFFIHIVRDGRDVSISLRNQLWGGWTEYERARYWSRMVQSAESAGQRIGPTKYKRVSYEDLVLRPELTVRSLCQFLGVKFEPSMLTFHEDAFDHIPSGERQRGHHEKLKRAPRASDVTRWKRELPWLRILLFESIAGRAMERVGAERRFGGAFRYLSAITAALYHPIGGCIAGIHYLYGQTPERVRNVFRRNHFLLGLRKAITRC